MRIGHEQICIAEHAFGHIEHIDRTTIDDIVYRNSIYILNTDRVFLMCDIITIGGYHSLFEPYTEFINLNTQAPNPKRG